MTTTAEAVRDRNKLTPQQLSGLDQPTQKAVVQAKLADMILKPAIDQAMKLGQKAVEKTKSALQGEDA
jgi:hypothetical protein